MYERTDILPYSREFEDNDLRRLVREVPDFPRPGVSFKDIMPLLQDVCAFRYVTDRMGAYVKHYNPARVVAIEARGFLLGGAIARAAEVPLVPARKRGKLPGDVAGRSYGLEYGTDTIEIQRDSIAKGNGVVIVDDVLATGGTVKAATQVVEELGGEVVGACFLGELLFLEGRKKLDGCDVFSILQFDR